MAFDPNKSHAANLAGGNNPPPVFAMRGHHMENGPSDTPSPANLLPPEPQAQRSQPSQVKIPNARDFQLLGKNLTLPPGPGSIIPFAPLRLAGGEVARISSAVLFINAPNLTCNIYFQILVNNQPVPGDDRLQSFPRVAQNLSIDFDIDIRVPARGIISALIVNEDGGGPWVVGFQVSGWRYSQVDAVRWYGSNS